MPDLPVRNMPDELDVSIAQYKEDFETNIRNIAWRTGISLILTPEAQPMKLRLALRSCAFRTVWTLPPSAELAVREASIPALDRTR